jgi:hypothetical protein
MILEKVSQELETYVRAKYPLIYLQTHEEGRAIDLLGRMVRRLDTNLFLWSCTKGFTHAMEAVGLIREPDILKPIDALDHIQRSANAGVYVLLDFHSYLNEGAIVRKLRDTIDVATSTTKSLFILSPKKVIPAECEKQFIWVELPPPDTHEIKLILEQSLNALKGRVKVQLSEDEKHQLIEAFRGLPSTDIENVLSRMIVRDGKLNSADLSDVICEKGRMIAASGLLQFYPPKENLDTVGGLSKLKVWLHRKRAGFSQNARDYGLDMPKGVLLVGIPGCGKSLTAKAISSLWQMPLLRLDIGQLFSSYIGSTEENMRKAIMTAESIAPCILWIDEIEKGLSGVQGNDSADGGVARRIFATLLTWMQEKKHPVFLVATANEVSSLPAEFLRKGRFDDIFFIDLPNLDERTAILSIHLTKRHRDPTRFDLVSLATRTDGFSGADLESIVSEALEASFLEGRDLEQSDLETAVSACVPLAATMSERIAEVRNWADGRARRAT